MVLRLVIFDTVHNLWHPCLPDESLTIMFAKENKHLRPSLMGLAAIICVNTSTCLKQSPILAAIGLALGASALFDLFLKLN